MSEPLQLTMLMIQEKPQPPKRDICARRHRGNAESIAANPSQFCKSKNRDDILRFLREAGPKTSKEINFALMMGYTTVSARLSELKAMQLIEPTGERREGAAVVRVKA